MNATIARYGTVLRCFDNGGRTADRYTVMPPRWDREHREREPGHFAAIASSAAPFHPQGFGQHVSACAGTHLGARVRWDALPADVRTFARQAFPEYAPGNP